MATHKEEALRGMRTEALQHIIDNPADSEKAEPSPEFPLGGKVHITGIGQVTLAQIRAELETR